MKIGKYEQAILRRVILNGGYETLRNVKTFIMGHHAPDSKTMDIATHNRVRKGCEQLTQSAISLETKGLLHLRRRPGLTTHRPIKDLYLTERALREGKSWELDVDKDGIPTLDPSPKNPETITTFTRHFRVDQSYDLTPNEEEE